MNIGVVGIHGKMGGLLASAIEKQDGLTLLYGVDALRTEPLGSVPVFATLEEAPLADIVIDFSHHLQLSKTIAYGKQYHIPLVIGTTGYSELQYQELLSASQITPIFFSQNYSVGLYIMRQALQTIQSMAQDFDIEIIERHHNQKIDAPSGTAKMLLETLQSSQVQSYQVIPGRHGVVGKRSKQEIGLHSIRGGSITGTHEVLFASTGEQIQLIHTAESKEVFVSGALKAAFFVYQKPAGLYHMSHLLGEHPHE